MFQILIALSVLYKLAEKKLKFLKNWLSFSLSSLKNEDKKKVTVRKNDQLKN